MADTDLPVGVKFAAIFVIGVMIGGTTVFLSASGESSIAATAITDAPNHNHALHSHSDDADNGAHDHSELAYLPAGLPVPTVDFTLEPDAGAGWNLHVITTNFEFAPQAVNQGPMPGEGHAHIYANGDKIARLYGPWLHLTDLPRGDVEIAITLNSNDHKTLAVGGQPVIARRTVRIE